MNRLVQYDPKKHISVLKRYHDKGYLIVNKAGPNETHMPLQRRIKLLKKANELKKKGIGWAYDDIPVVDYESVNDIEKLERKLQKEISFKALAPKRTKAQLLKAYRELYLDEQIRYRNKSMKKQEKAAATGKKAVPMLSYWSITSPEKETNTEMKYAPKMSMKELESRVLQMEMAASRRKGGSKK